MVEMSEDKDKKEVKKKEGHVEWGDRDPIL